MNSLSFYNIVILFMVYSFLGWIIETLYALLSRRKLVNRGFLKGPYIAGFGLVGVFLYLIFRPFLQNLTLAPLVFLGSFVIISGFLYLSNFISESMIGFRVHNFDDKKYNIHGRVSLEVSLVYSIFALVFFYLINPSLFDLLASYISASQTDVLGSVLLGFMLLDLLVSLNEYSKLNIKLDEADHILYDLINYHDLDLDQIKAYILDEKKIQDMDLYILIMSLRSILKDDSGSRIIRAYDNITYPDNTYSFDLVKDLYEKDTVLVELKESIDHTTTEIWKWGETEKGMTFYKAFWIFFVASITGFIVETIYCYLTLGYIESRKGLIYGPFSHVYGFGAIVIIFFLEKLMDKGDVAIFLGSATIGGLFEVACAYISEWAFGSVSWDYTHQAFHFFGAKTSLRAMIFWAFLGYFLVKVIYPRLMEFIYSLPKKQGMILAVVLSIFLVLNMLISYLAVSRWADRRQGQPASNIFEVFLDQTYPDQRMEDIYPNMMFLE